jgi:hypothetical protein
MKNLSFTSFWLTIQILIFYSQCCAQILGPLNLRPDALTSINGSNLSAANTKAVSFQIIPAKSALEAIAIWSNDSTSLSFLNAASLSGNKDGGTASIDVVSDFLGPVRFSIAGIVAAADSGSSIEKKRQRFLAGGGTAVITATFLGPTASWGKGGFAMLMAIPRLGLDFPALGNSTSDSNANLDLGAEARLNAPFAENELGLFGSIRASYVTGGNDFYKSLGFASDNYNPFFYSQLNIGLNLQKLGFALLWTKTLGAPSELATASQNGKFSLIISSRH